MGYTHYWTPKKTSATKFKIFSDTCKKLYDNLPEKSNTAGGYYSDEKIEIGNYDGSELKPEFSKKAVGFNGMNENAHETFRIALNENDWDFCKTARKPYDLLVCTCLLAAVDILGFKISSDGWIEDWIPAMEFYNKVLDTTSITESHLLKIGIKQNPRKQ